MKNRLDREILRLAIPSILANITVPIVGMVDTAVAGHLPAAGGAGPAEFIGAISIGSMLFTLLYWSFGFLRTGTGGLTAQAYGRADMTGASRIFVRGTALALAAAALILIFQLPYVKFAMWCTAGSAEVERLAQRYFLVRVWAAPATISLMVFRGWFTGMQDSLRSMWADLTVNFVNIAASIVLALGIGSWKGLGFDGVALGTVVAQYCGLLYCLLAFRFRYGRKVASSLAGTRLMEAFRGMGGFMKMNMDYFGRSLFFMVVYMGYTMAAAGLGDLMLACSAILMQLLMLFSYFTDGFAYAGEALTGRFIGEGSKERTGAAVKRVFVWSMVVAAAFTLMYMAAGTPILRILTDDPDVVASCRPYIPWLALMPLLGCAAFTWDGIYIGATASRPTCTSMMGAAVCFTAVWFLGKLAFAPGDEAAMHWLMGAYFAHLLFRTVWLSALSRKEIFQKPFA